MSENRDSRTRTTRVRWVFYILVGIIFGVLDYFFIAPAISDYIVPSLAVWLIPLIPIAIYEMRASGAKYKTVLASILCWVVAVLAYYVCYYLTLALSPSMISVGWGEILADIALWGIFAIVTGGITGFFISIIYKLIHNKKSARMATDL